MIGEKAYGSLSELEFQEIYHGEEEKPCLNDDGGGNKGVHKLRLKQLIDSLLIFALFSLESFLFYGHSGVLRVLVSYRIFFDNSCMRKPFAPRQHLEEFPVKFWMNPWC
ncbi:hypothetical protein OIU84_009813 [Salix udensis]|uniref:Uncharacterized protein n=1 Tax=Salix udensis TaxID=889485 RepID=A0AAD6JJE5_9ROSI|nr:hypothetical protein OIU84_009813 [Salix udensis]